MTIQQTQQKIKENKFGITGKLIVVEGIDGSGKSTQIRLLEKWLRYRNIRVFLTEWNSSEAIKDVTAKGKKKEKLTPTTFSLLHATDFADRYERNIFPLLRAGYIVLADRYIFTLMARDAVRRINQRWSHNLYGFAMKPSLIFYLDVEPRELLRRVFEKNMTLDYYESGEDLGLSDDLLESFLLYQQKIKQQFIRMQKSYGIIPIDGNRSIESINIDLQKKIDQCLSTNNYTCIK